MERRDPSYYIPSEVVIVEASAGSGKTYALAKRYLQLLINPTLKLEHIPIKSILAITFTNKAAIEMKERILELLKKLALDAFSNKDEEREILRILGVDKKIARAKASLIMDEIIKHYNFFQIQTIDSFINALLLGCALNIGRSASFKIKRDYTQYLSYCLDLTIEDATVNSEMFKILEEFLQHYLFVENRRGWFPKEDILALMQSLFTLSNKYGELFRMNRGASKDIIERKKKIYQQIKELSHKLPEGINGNTKKYIHTFLDKNEQIFDIGNLPSAFRTPEVPMNKGKDAPLHFKEKWRRIHQALKELIELDATTAYNPYVQLFDRLLDFFQLISKREDVLFLEELNRKARLLFDDIGITVAELYYRFATRFKHYLIDEFQDTSLLQWRNLEMMIEEALSSGGSLFYVGDKKQAIYRFRGGEVKLFDEVKKKFSQFNIKPTYLTKNWRSQKTIVEFNNKVFSKENLLKALRFSGIVKELEQDSKTEGIVNIFKDANQVYREDNVCGYVRVERIDEKDQKDRDEIMRPKVLKLIDELNGRFRYGDITILTRDNREVELITSWLLEEGIPVESEKTMNVLENPLIKEIISFLKFLFSPIDDLSFASFILGKLFAQATGISDREITRFLFVLNKENKIRSGLSLYRLFRNQYPKVWDGYIDEFFKSVGFISCYELVISIYQRFRVLTNFKGNQAFFMKFLELIKAKEDEYPGLGEMLSYLQEAPQEDLYVEVTHSNSVKVLTIHKSKGLEFPVVIIPFLRMDIVPETVGKGTGFYIVGEGGYDLSLVRITKTHRAYSKVLQDIYTEAYKEACIDELNKMYVALTRAQFELYIFIPRKSGASRNKACFFIPEEIRESGIQKKYRRTDTKSQPLLINIPPSTYTDWIEFLKDEFGDLSSIRNRERIMQGNIYHFALSCIGNLHQTRIEVAIREAIKNVQVRYPFIEDSTSIENKINLLIKNSELKKIFFVDDGEVYCEKEIVDTSGNTKRIDRLIVKENEVWIVDYKTSRESEEEHTQQVIEYIRIIKDIYPLKQVKGFLVYLEEMHVQEINI